MEEKFNILVVDDEEMICQAVTAYFTANGYTVFAADSGKKAVDVFSTEKIDFVILDLMLPEMTGGRSVRTFENCILCTYSYAYSQKQAMMIQ